MPRYAFTLLRHADAASLRHAAMLPLPADDIDAAIDADIAAGSTSRQRAAISLLFFDVAALFYFDTAYAATDAILLRLIFTLIFRYCCHAIIFSLLSPLILLSSLLPAFVTLPALYDAIRYALRLLLRHCQLYAMLLLTLRCFDT